MTRLGRGGLYRLANALLGWVAPSRDGAAPPAEGPCVIGHRGAPCEAPENTIPSFERALALGADAIETDVCVTRDGEVVLWHDADPDGKLSLARQAGAERHFVVPDVPEAGSRWRKRVRELELARLREHYGYTVRRDDRTGDQDGRIPFATLPDLHAWLAGPARAGGAAGARVAGRPTRVYLDIKLDEDQAGDARILFDAVRALCDGPGASRDTSFHLMSVQREIVAALLAAVGAEGAGRGIHIYADFERPGVLQDARRLGARRVGMGRRGRVWGAYRRELRGVLAASRAGRLDSVVPWTVNEEKELRVLLRMGARALMTDEIACLRRLMSEAPR